ncbi:unnamed protein product, partial [Chrysoparadoxa australica]
DKRAERRARRRQEGKERRKTKEDSVVNPLEAFARHEAEKEARAASAARGTGKKGEPEPAASQRDSIEGSRREGADPPASDAKVLGVSQCVEGEKTGTEHEKGELVEDSHNQRPEDTKEGQAIGKCSESE